MSELTQQATPEEMATELETLRRVNGELKTKSATRKARVTELEATVTELQSKLSEASDSLRQVTIDGPLKQMSESISTAPELFLEQFSKSYRLEMVKGQLTLQTIDGKPVLKGEKPVPFEREALAKLLTAGDDAQAKIFKSITVVSRASGANSQRSNRHSQSASVPRPSFGLR
jgi:uncharacterized coiled-coil protein SlyX